MPANLPPDYYAAERRYREAGTIREKIEILREMMAIMPKHKGTEHLQGDLKRRIAKLNSQAQKKQGTARASGLDHIPSEGAGQVALVGPPNVGKSAILSGLTNAHSEIAEYPFSTFKPIQGMMEFEDIQIQLVDMPPISPEYTETWVFNIIRLADLILLVVDLSSESSDDQVLETRRILEDHKIHLQRMGDSRPQGPVAYKSTLMVGTKADLNGTKDRAKFLSKTFENDFPCTFISMKTLSNVDELRKSIFECLCVIRIYTKTPGNKSDFEKPYILPRGTTVKDAAKAIHKDIAETMKYARIWGSDKYDGQRVERDHIMEDGDVIEIHTR